MFKFLKKLIFNYLLFTLIFLDFTAFSQEIKEEKPDWIQFHGFVNYELMYDSRLSQTARDGEVMLYPKPFEGDKNGLDINDHGKLHMFSLHTRLRADIKEYSLLNMKVSGAIEFDFIGSNDATLNLIRLRHAYVKLASSKFEWLAGQYWHPMFATNCYPELISWGAAAPIHVLNRSPQLRLTYSPNKKMTFMGSISSQRDFVSSGPMGNSAEYIKNAQIPEMSFQFNIQPSSGFIGGFTAGYKVIVPRLVTDSGYISNETLGSYNFNAFVRYKKKNIDFKIQGIYGQNMSNFVLLGGYAVKRITDIQTNEKEYVNIQTGSVWSEIAYSVHHFSFGLFAGYTKGFGTNEYINTITEVYGLGNNVLYMYNLSPRIVYAPGKLKIALELNKTAACFGSYDHYLKGVKVNFQVNYRFLFSVSLIF